MCLISKCERRVNLSGLTMAYTVCYSAAAEMELNKPKKLEQANERVSTTDFNKVFNGNVRYSCNQRSAEMRFYVIIM